MAKLTCPGCGAAVDSPDGWAKAALSTLMPAPPVPGMATRLRCPHCAMVFTQVPGRAGDGWRGLLPALLLLALLLAVALLVPG